MSIADLAWFAIEGAEPRPTRERIGVLVEAEIASDESSATFHLLVENFTGYALEVDYVLPPGTSTRVLEIPRFSEPPAGADLERTMISVR